MAAVAALRPPTMATGEALGGIHQLLDRLDTSDVVGGTAAGVMLGEVDRAIRRLQSVRLALVAEADRDNVAADKGMTGTAAWLAATTREGSAEAARDVKLATALDDALGATRQALADGSVSTEHARVIADVQAKLPKDLSPREREAIERSLVAEAKVLDPATLRKHGRRCLAAADRPPEEVDRHEDTLLRTEEQAALARTRLSLHDNGDGTLSGHFTVPTFAGSVLKKVVQQIASPRRFAQQAAKAARDQGALTSEEVAAGTWEAFRAEDLSWEQKYGRALVELLEHLPTDHLTGKVNATVVVTVDHDALSSSLGAAHLDTGDDLSASQARRLACNAGILPAVLGGSSQVLDLGRTERFFTEAQRVAIATRYDTCAAQGCDRPVAWAELHHEDPWAAGGATDLDKAVPLCGQDHRRAHDPTYATRIRTDERGVKTVTFTRRT